MSFTINCYRCSCEKNRVDKTDYLSPQGSINGTLRGECDIMYPSITIESDSFPNFNYVEISAFNNRYYYVVNISSINNGLWNIELECDVLHTYRNTINNCYAFVDRNEFLYNRLIIDDKRVVQQGIDIIEDVVYNKVFALDGEYVYYLSGFSIGYSEA